MSDFRLFLLNLLDPDRLGYGEKLLQSLTGAGDYQLCFPCPLSAVSQAPAEAAE